MANVPVASPGALATRHVAKASRRQAKAAASAEAAEAAELTRPLPPAGGYTFTFETWTPGYENPHRLQVKGRVRPDLAPAQRAHSHFELFALCMRTHHRIFPDRCAPLFQR